MGIALRADADPTLATYFCSLDWFFYPWMNLYSTETERRQTMFSRRKFAAGVTSALTASVLPRAHASAEAVTASTSEPPIIGFDCHTYPGDKALKAFREQNDFRVTCLYLSHTPTGRDDSWIRKREDLALKGWGLFPTFLGTDIASPAESSGTEHGKNAVALMKDAKFATGSIVYLDIETPKPAGGPFEKYVRAWMKVVRDNGFYPGVYGSYLMVPWLKNLTSAIWTVELPNKISDALETARSRGLDVESAFASGNLPSANTNFYIELFSATILGYDPRKNPHGIIRDNCIATQYIWKQQFNVPLDAGIKNDFDLNWSAVADPSNAACVAHYLKLKELI